MKRKEGLSSWSVWGAFLAVALWLALPYLSQGVYHVEQYLQQKQWEQAQQDIDEAVANIPIPEDRLPH